MNDFRESEPWNRARALLLAVRQLIAHSEADDLARRLDRTCLMLLEMIRTNGGAGTIPPDLSDKCAKMIEHLERLVGMAQRQHILTARDAFLVMRLALSIRSSMTGNERKDFSFPGPASAFMIF